MLIVDDSKAMRGFLSALASDLGFIAVEAEDGRDGLEKLIRNDPATPFEIVLIDWDMPRLTGIELVELIRRNRDYDSLKLMMVTTNNTEEKITRALEAGANDFLMKPVTKEAFEEKILILGLIN